MRIRTTRAALLTIGAAGYWLASAACTVNSVTNNGTGDDAGTTNTDAGADTGTVDTDSGVDTDAGIDADAAEPQAFVRLAHLSPDAPAVDVCFTSAGSDYTGQTPQLAQITTVIDAGTTADGGAVVGLSYPQVTTYLIVPPGAYAVRLVAAGSVDCSTPVADLASVTLNDGTYTTVAAVGEAHVVQTDQALKLVSFADEVTAPAGTSALRFINASPSLTSVDFGTGTNAATTFAPLVTGVAFGAAGTTLGADAGTIDASGYLSSQPLAGATLSAHVTNGSADTATAASVTVNAASAATFVLIGGVTGGGAPAQLLECPDADDSAAASLIADCTIVSPTP